MRCLSGCTPAENESRRIDRQTAGRVTRLPSPTDLVGVNFTATRRFFRPAPIDEARRAGDHTRTHTYAHRTAVIKYSIIGTLALARGLTVPA